MLTLSKKVEYGLIALLHMDSQASSNEVIASKEIAEKHGLSVDLMGKVVQSMARADLLDAEHGPKGGYRLHGPLDTISLGQVITSIEGPPRLVRCQQDSHDCLQSSSCIVKEPLLAIHDRLSEFIDGITMDQLRGREAVTFDV